MNINWRKLSNWVLTVLLLPVLIIAGLYIRSFFVLPDAIMAKRSSSPFVTKPGLWQHLPLNTGVVHMDKTVLLNPDHPGKEKFKDDGSAVIIYSHLLRHPVHGDILIDAGLDSSVEKSPYANVEYPGKLWLLGADITFSQDRGKDTISQLENYKADVKQLYITHAHVDHTFAISSLPDNMQIYLGPGESDEPAYRILDNGHFENVDKLYELDFSDSVSTDLGQAVDLFGDSSLWAINTPGHTGGHLSFLVRTKSGLKLLTGDACHFQWNFVNGVGPLGGWSARNTMAQQSLEKIIDFSENHPDVEIWFGHQPPLDN